MTPDEIQAIRERLLRATPGPWKAGAGVTLSYVTLAGDIWTDVADGIESADDADLISHAPTDLAALLDEVERLREEVARQQNMPCAKLIAELRAQVTILTQDHLWETEAVERVRKVLDPHDDHDRYCDDWERGSNAMSRAVRKALEGHDNA